MSGSPLKQNKIVPLADLVAHPRNYRSHPKHQIDRLVLSLQRFGQGRSIVIQDAPEHPIIVAGHGIVEAARALQWTELRADILPADWTDQQVEGYLIADNLHSQEASDNDELLAMLLQEQQNAGFDLASLGSDDEALRQMLQEMGDEIISSGEDEEDFIPAEGPTRTHTGELWQLGEHRLLVGDSTNAEDVKRLLQGKKADMLFADPPYDLALDWTEIAERYCSKHWLVMAGDKQQAALAAKYLQSFNGFYVLYFRQFSWNLNKYIPLLTHVLTAHLRFADAKNYDLNGMHSLTESPSKFDKEQEHHHAKHADYLQQFVEGFSAPGDLVFVPFLGSGTELIACQRTGRVCYGIEIEPKYADVILKRFEEETGKVPELLTEVTCA